MAETVGSLIDKLSISQLRIWHTRDLMEAATITAENHHRCRHRLAVIEEQRDDLAHELSELWRDLIAGAKPPKIYRQYKMYNDPELRAGGDKLRRRSDDSSGSSG